MTQEFHAPEVVQPTPVVSESDLEAALKVAERNELLARKIKTLALKQTNPKDWADMDGKPYLQASGAEKIARLFGISWRICEGYPQREDQKDDKGSYYVYTYKGEFEMGGKTIEVIGTCSQRDRFFGRKGGELKNESEIDVTNIIRKAMTNMEVNGITRMLGIRNLTWEELAEAGLKQGQSAQVNYKTKAGETEEVEGLITSYFSIPPEQLRERAGQTEGEYYEDGHYRLMSGFGGYSGYPAVDGYVLEGDVLTLECSYYFSGDEPYMRTTLRIRLREDGFSYLSNHVEYMIENVDFLNW